MSNSFSNTVARIKLRNNIVTALKHGVMPTELVEGNDKLLSSLIQHIHLEEYGVGVTYDLMNAKVLALTHDAQIKYIVKHYNLDLLKNLEGSLTYGN